MKTLYTKLITAYSEQNLNRITSKLIALYKHKNFQQIRQIANVISEYVQIEEAKDARCFSKLVMLYHPDRGARHRREIEQAFSAKNEAKLSQFSHIFLLDNLEDIPVATVEELFDDSSDYQWDDSEQNGVSYYSDDEEETDEFVEFEFEKNFFNAVKMRIYGNLEIELPPHYLEDFEEIEMAGSEIEFLDGVQYCKDAISLDLTDNNLTDLTELRELDRLEELYLANNQIGYLDGLDALLNLKIIDLANNDVDDLTPILALPKLEFVNLSGNAVPNAQVQKLQQKGVVVLI